MTALTLPRFRKESVLKVNPKVASEIGSSLDSQFERSFAEMAFSVIQDRSPRLTDYLQGFQLIDRAEDKRKAVGVFGFLVGKQWMFIPTFFLAGGNLKGIELLWLKDTNTFVPNAEKWVNHLIGRKPSMLGKPSKMDAYQSGGRMPSLYRMTRLIGGAGGKVGSLNSIDINLDHTKISAWAEPFYKMSQDFQHNPDKILAHGGVKIAREISDLEEVLTKSAAARKAAAYLCHYYPTLKEGFDRFYPGKVKLADFDPAVMEADLRHKAIKSTLKPRKKLNLGSKKAELELWTSGNSLPFDVTATEQADLLQNGYTYRDKRAEENLSKLVNVATTLDISNPTTTGIYEVLCSDAKFRRCVVFIGAYDRDGCKTRQAVILPLDDKDKYNGTSAMTGDVFIAYPGNDDKAVEDYKAWFNDQSNASPQGRGAHFIMVGPDRTALAPFSINKSLDDDALIIDFTGHYCGGNKPKWLAHFDYDVNDYPSNGTGERYRYDITLARNSKCRNIQPLGSTIAVPEGFKLLQIKDPYRDYNLSGSEELKEKTDINLGTMTDVRRVVEGATDSFRVFNANGGEYITKVSGHEFRGTAIETIWKLARYVGLPMDVAVNVVKEANSLRAAGQQHRIKLADSYANALGSIAPSMPPPWETTEPTGPYRSYRGTESQEEEVPIDSMSASKTDPQTYDPWRQAEHMKETMQYVQDAQQGGDKEVFDVSMLKSLHQIVRQDDLLDRRIGKLMVAVNEWGTILYLFYWHGDKFSDRFGTADMPQLESTLRNAFETSGDGTLYLKEKSVNTGEGLPGFDSSGEPTIDEAGGS
jgi:hypothetical protein